MSMALGATAHPVRTVTTADDGWYRSVTSFAQHTGWLQEPMKLYTTGAIGLLALLALYGWWTARTARDPRAMAAVAWLGFGTIVSVLAGLVAKGTFAENRPCQAIHVATVQACPGTTDYSFPSDHTTVAVALALGLFLVNRRLGAVGIVLALIEGFSRVYLGQHYPHDVLAAFVLSGVVVLGGWPLVRGPLTRLDRALERTPLRPILTSAPARA